MLFPTHKPKLGHASAFFTLSIARGVVAPWGVHTTTHLWEANASSAAVVEELFNILVYLSPPLFLNTLNPLLSSKNQEYRSIVLTTYSFLCAPLESWIDQHEHPRDLGLIQTTNHVQASRLAPATPKIYSFAVILKQAAVFLDLRGGYELWRHYWVDGQSKPKVSKWHVNFSNNKP